MGNEEYKEIMCELFKFLRDKISLSLGQYLTDEQKEKLYSFEPENIIVGRDSNKIIEYSLADDKIYISDEFLTPEYVKKIREKNPEFDVVDLKNRVNEENPRVLLEEFISFSDELKITEKDLIKSLFIQEILKMVLMNREMDAKEDAIMTGTIELLAHTLGSQNGFVVSTPKKYVEELDVAISLKEELDDKFESIVLGGNILEHLSRIENSRLLKKIDELADNRKIIESTQNLDNVIDSIVNMTKENENKEENLTIEQEPIEEIVEITDTEEPKEIPIEVTKEQLHKEEVPVEEKAVEKDVTESKLISDEMPQNDSDKKATHISKKVILSIIGLLLTVILGVVVGYLLFKFK